MIEAAILFCRDRIATASLVAWGYLCGVMLLPALGLDLRLGASVGAMAAYFLSDRLLGTGRHKRAV